MNQKPPKKTLSDEEKFLRQVRRKTVLSFIGFFLFILLCWIGCNLLNGAPKERNALAPLRHIMDLNARLFSRSYTNSSLAKEFPKDYAARKVRVNGNIGLRSALDTVDYKVKLVKYSLYSPQTPDTILIPVSEFFTLPKTEVVFNFKCIEGWSQITWWGGVRFSEVLKKYNAGTIDGSSPDPINHPEKLYNYVGLKTPDGGYYVGIDMASMLHPQTILCYEMNNLPLPENQGAPIRLIIPVKYGIKHLKRIGVIYFSQQPPPDYWADRGYDYFAGL
ncbi:MAG: molybdopterin-dependent oxidoreductase [Bacteroidia bacterium]